MPKRFSRSTVVLNREPIRPRARKDAVRETVRQMILDKRLAAGAAKPRTLVKGQPGVRIEIDLEFASGRRHLPVVHLKRAA